MVPFRKQFHAAERFNLGHTTNLAVVATAACARGNGGVNLRQPEVGYLRRPGRVEQDVKALQVPVDDAVHVQESQALLRIRTKTWGRVRTRRGIAVDTSRKVLVVCVVIRQNSARAVRRVASSEKEARYFDSRDKRQRHHVMRCTLSRVLG